MNVRIFIGVLSLLSLGGCAASNLSKTAASAATVGLASCGPNEMQYCKPMAGKTHRGWGPTQFEYFAPDGTLYLWIGKQIRRGKWSAGNNMFGPVICYQYGGYGATDCRKAASELKMKEETLDGDPFELSTRSSVPFDLLFGERRPTAELLARIRTSPPSAADKPVTNR